MVNKKITAQLLAFLEAIDAEQNVSTGVIGTWFDYFPAEDLSEA
jgi:hypothetical protein